MVFLLNIPFVLLTFFRRLFLIHAHIYMYAPPPPPHQLNAFYPYFLISYSIPSLLSILSYRFNKSKNVIVWQKLFEAVLKCLLPVHTLQKTSTHTHSSATTTFNYCTLTFFPYYIIIIKCVCVIVCLTTTQRFPNHHSKHKIKTNTELKCSRFWTLLGACIGFFVFLVANYVYVIFENALK